MTFWNKISYLLKYLYNYDNNFYKGVGNLVLKLHDLFLIIYDIYEDCKSKKKY